MKFSKLTYQLLIIALVSCAVALVGCSEDNKLMMNDGAIRFGSYGVNYVSEADATDIDITKAILWGYYGDEVVYDGVDATLSVNESQLGLTPDGDAQYWTSNTYNFYSLWPKIDGATGSTSGVSIVDFEISKQIDLCLASTIGVNGSEAIADPNHSVYLNYKHLLSKIYFKGMVEANESGAAMRAKLNSISLEIPGKGTYNNQKWTLTGTTKLSDNTGWNLTGTAQDIISDGWLVFPQEFGSGVIKVTLNFVDNTGGNSNKIGHIPARTWEAGKYYTYTFAIDAAGMILFDEPTITAWGEASAGPSIVF